jgi:proteasome alpha subunit
MNEERESYDQSITIYSPDGRMFQVEYAREAVKKGSISVGLTYKDGVIIMVQKRLPSTLIIPESVEKIFQIENYMACSTAGLIADARVLVDYAREDAADYKIKYNETMPVLEVVKRISNIKRIYTQYGGVRPFGVSFLIGGIDPTGVQLYETDPSGAYKKYQAGAIGENKKEVESIFEDNYKDNMTFKKAIKLALGAIATTNKADIKDINIEIITLTKKDLFNKLDEAEVEKLKKEF